MVLQELPPGDAPQLLQQYPRIIAELFNHPSIVAWVLPQGMNADAAKQLTEAIRKADPTRLVLGGPDGDIREIAPADVEKAGPSKQATILSPLGDIQAPLPGHAWTAGAVSSPVNLTANYLDLAQKMAAWKTKAGLSGFIYKQFADAGDDHSGLVASDRQGIKLDLEQVALRQPPCFAVSASRRWSCPSRERRSTVRRGGRHRPDIEPRVHAGHRETVRAVDRPAARGRCERLP